MLSLVSWVMRITNMVKGRAVVILSMDATHLLMASEDSDVVGMMAIPRICQGPQGLTCIDLYSTNKGQKTVIP